MFKNKKNQFLKTQDSPFNYKLSTPILINKYTYFQFAPKQSHPKTTTKIRLFLHKHLEEDLEPWAHSTFNVKYANVLPVLFTERD